MSAVAIDALVSSKYLTHISRLFSGVGWLGTSAKMWLIRTNTGELKHFNNASDVPGGYAILSHVWQDKEMSFQELQALRSDFPLDPPRARASAKIKECCILAESHGYKWLWVDTCCIDRTSSAELSEAINSMYAWYSQASVCYAYLYDVPQHGGLARRNSPFRKSKWHTRGWTLQELIAPRDVVFLSENWEVIGTKASLAALLEQITGVDADVLTFRRQVSDVSVARRMWWASNRRSTRVEDVAYSLMGIFGVHMPTIYGEGVRAFRRLQEEILKRTSDQTLFAWGNVIPIHSRPFREPISYSNYHHDSYLFASSPAAFWNSAHMVPLPIAETVKHVVAALGIASPFGAEKNGKMATRNKRAPYPVAVPDFTMTSHGARSQMLVVESCTSSFAIAVGVLACRDDSTGSLVGLLLRRRRHEDTNFKNPRYHIGVTIRGLSLWARLRYRLAPVEWTSHVLSFGQTPITAEWKQIYIAHRTSSRMPAPSRLASGSFRFYFPKWLQVELRKCGFEPDVALPTTQEDAHNPRHQAPHSSFIFTHHETNEAFRIQVGQSHNAPWATAEVLLPGEGSPPRSQLSLHDHGSPLPLEHHKNRVNTWSNGTKTFGDSERSVQLTFTRVNEGATHLLDVRLAGRTYGALNFAVQKAMHPVRLAHSWARLCSRI